MQPQLSPGYRLDYSDPNVLTLCSPQESVVARFSARGYVKEMIEQAAWEHYRNGSPST